ncbi:MAG: DUF5681 domain-containing protein [Xanthobacteraceae bacterium]
MTTHDSKSGSYRVGKGRPPEAHRFKPGQSGNPNGRPKDARNAASLAKAELSRKITVTVNGRKRRMSVAELSTRRLGDKAATGDQKALGFLFMLANNVDMNEAKARDFTTPEQDLSIITDYFKRHKFEDGDQS